jgi:hypothetical protein
MDMDCQGRAAVSPDAASCDRREETADEREREADRREARLEERERRADEREAGLDELAGNSMLRP